MSSSYRATIVDADRPQHERSKAVIVEDDRVLHWIPGRTGVVAGRNDDLVGAVPDGDRRRRIGNRGGEIAQRGAADEDRIQFGGPCETREVFEETMGGLEAVVASAPREGPGFVDEDSSHLRERDTHQDVEDHHEDEGAREGIAALRRSDGDEPGNRRERREPSEEPPWKAEAKNTGTVR